MRTIFTLSLLFILLVSGAASGAVLFSNPYSSSSNNAYSSVWPDNSGPVHQSFTDYDYSGIGTITDFHWWGTYGGYTNNLSGFTFEIWTNDGGSGQPLAKVYDQYLSGNADESLVGTNPVYAADVYKYSLTLDTPFDLGAGKYWFSVAAHNYGSYNNWYWALGDGTYGTADWQHAFITGSSYWASLSGGHDLAFEVTGPSDNVVPEPASLILMGLGLLAGLLVIRPRSK